MRKEKDCGWKGYDPFSIGDDGGLLWNNFKVPTVEQLTAVLNPVHFKDEKHTSDVQRLQKQLTDKGFVFPAFWGVLKDLLKCWYYLGNRAVKKGLKVTY